MDVCLHSLLRGGQEALAPLHAVAAGCGGPQKSLFFRGFAATGGPAAEGRRRQCRLRRDSTASVFFYTALSTRRFLFGWWVNLRYLRFEARAAERFCVICGFLGGGSAPSWRLCAFAVLKPFHGIRHLVSGGVVPHPRCRLGRVNTCESR